jgi:hypothetical protein
MIEGRLFDAAAISVELTSDLGLQYVTAAPPPAVRLGELREENAEHVKRGGFAYQVVVRADVVFEVSV